MIKEISSFYKHQIASTLIEKNSQGATIRFAPLTRGEYFSGSCLGSLFTIQKIAFSVIDLLANIFTLGLNQRIRNSFLEDLDAIPKHIGAIVLGLMGSIFPQGINQSVLHLPCTKKFPTMTAAIQWKHARTT